MVEDENHHNPLHFGKTFKLHILDGFKTSGFVKDSSGGSRISQMASPTPEFSDGSKISQTGGANLLFGQSLSKTA